MRYSAIRVALPRHNTSTPVAAGSSVPVWPTFDIPNSVRALATTSWDVHPAGLLMTSTPSKATPARRSVRSSFTTIVLPLCRLRLYLIQQRHHPLHPIERGILDKRQLGDVPQLQAPPQLAPDEPLGQRQHRQRLWRLPLSEPVPGRCRSIVQTPTTIGREDQSFAATLSTVKTSNRSPGLTSLKFSTVMPHSYPACTSFTSSLKRRSEASLPSYTTTPSRTTRTLAPARTIVPSVT